MKKIKEYLTNKTVVVFALSMVIILSSFSYALFNSVDNTDEQIVTTECFKLTFSDENEIDMDKSYPMTESEGIKLVPYEFTLKNVCKKTGEYQVNIEIKEDTTLSTNYLRYKINNRTTKILGNELEVQEYINENIKESRNIEAGIIFPNEEITYNLRMWIDENATVEQSANKIIKSKVVVKTIENKEPYQTIILNTNGGEITHNEVIKIKQREIGELEEPTREGYNFLGWYKDIELTNKITDETKVTNELTNLYAKWEAREDTTYKVEHYQMDTNGEYTDVPFETDNLTGTTDTNVTPSVRTYEGFTSPQEQTVNIDADGNRVVKYYYERNKYLVNYVTQGTLANTSEEIYYGDLATMPTPIRDGYTFNGWFNQDTGGTMYPSLYVVTGQVTMYGQWTPKTYTITYNYQNNIYNQDTSTWQYHGNTRLDSSNQYNGTPGVAVYSNAGIYRGIFLPLNSDKKKNTNYEISVYAKRTTSFSGNLRGYLPTYDSSNAVISYNHVFSINTSNLTTNTWVKYTGRFNSGNYSAIGELRFDYDQANQGPVYLSNIRLDEFVTSNLLYGTTLGTLPTPTRSGYIFRGWYTSPTGGTKISNTTSVPLGNTTYYAQWDVPTFSITMWQKPAEQGVSTTTIKLGNTTYTSVGGTTSSSLANYWYARSYTTNVVGGTQVILTSSYGASTKWYKTSDESGYVCTGTKFIGIAPSYDSSIFVVPDVGGHDNSKRRVISSLTGFRCE